MSPRLPRITSREMLRILKKHGFEIVRVSGSHYILRDGRNRRTNVPHHSGEILKLGTLASIMDESGLTVEDLLKEL